MQDHAVTDAMVKGWGNQIKPKGLSQQQLILKHLGEGKSLTSLQAARLYAIVSLSKRVMELIELGHPIGRTWTKFPSGRYGMTYHL